MAHIVGGVHQMCSLTEKGVHTSGNNDSFNLTLFAG
jgi:hypothetical protein